MTVACSTQCFGRLSLEQCFAKIRELQFQKVDLAIHWNSNQLQPSEIFADVQRAVQRIKACMLPIAALHLDFGKQYHGTTEKEHFRTMCRFGRLISAPIITIPAANQDCSMEEEKVRLTELAKIAAGEGLILTVDTRRGTLTEFVLNAILLCEAIPQLKLTLDPTVYLLEPQQELEPLYQYVRHVRLRDSGTQSQHYQTRVGQGVVEFSKIHSSLAQFHYNRAYTVDVQEIPDSEFPIEPEVRKLKFLLECL